MLAIRIGHGLLLTELVPSDLGLQKKLASGASRISYPDVNGDQGIWIEGGPHVVALTRPDGGLDLRTLRLAGNVLVWQHGARTLRLEGPTGLDEALKLARTIR